MHALLAAAFLLLRGLNSGLGVRAQLTNATCLAQFNWLSNARNQTPCLVAAYLEAQCLVTPRFIPKLPPNTHYTGPTLQEANPCLCSTVTYSLMSACGACQSHQWQNWTTWSMNCPATWIGIYPRSIPEATEVPSWAYMNLTVTNETFNLVAAQANISTPAATLTSSFLSTIASSTVTTSEQVTQSVQPTAEFQSSSVGAGTIAGSVVGALGFITISCVLGFWFYSRRRRRGLLEAPSRLGEKAILDDDIGAVQPSTLPSFSAGPTPMSTPSPYIYDERSMSPLSGLTSGIYTTRIPRTSLETTPRSPQHLHGGSVEM